MTSPIASRWSLTRSPPCVPAPCIIDGEAVACDENGVASFDLVRNHRANDSVFLYAFDLIELNGDDLRRDPLEVRKATLEMMLAKAGSGIRFNEHMEGDGEIVFRHACKMGLEGIVSKRKDSPYRSGRPPDCGHLFMGARFMS
jgi:bifunctional non-homologous end joining protein LigD